MENNRDLQVLNAAYEAWRSWGAFRAKRQRNKNFTYGSQWGDVVTDSYGNRVTEYKKLQQSGHEPLTNNVIRRLVRTIVGRFRNNIADEQCDAQIKELDSRVLEEFLISGCCLQRVDWGRVENLNVNRFFSNIMEDILCRDCKIAGYLHDMNLSQLIRELSHGDRARAAMIRKTYTHPAVPQGMMGEDVEQRADFFTASRGLVRAIEVWTLELQEVIECHDRARGELFTMPVNKLVEIEAENCRRQERGVPLIDSSWGIDEQWHCRWFAPTGECLLHYLSPYSHGGHPYAIKLYPLTDGEVHSFVEDVIDQQKYINRLITLIDHTMQSSAKGVLLYPDTSLPAGFTWDDIKRLWRSPDGIIPYNMLPNGQFPQQVVNNNSNIGAYELLSLQMNLMEEISGIGSVLQGNSGSNRQGAQLYEKQVENATISLRDVFDSFQGFRAMRDGMMAGA